MCILPLGAGQEEIEFVALTPRMLVLRELLQKAQEGILLLAASGGACAGAPVVAAGSIRTRRRIEVCVSIGASQRLMQSQSGSTTVNDL